MYLSVMFSFAFGSGNNTIEIMWRAREMCLFFSLSLLLLERSKKTYESRRCRYIKKDEDEENQYSIPSDSIQCFPFCLFFFGFSLNAYRYPVFSAHLSIYIESQKQIRLFHHEFAGFCSSTFDPYEALLSIWFLSYMWCRWSSYPEFLHKGMYLLSQLEISELEKNKKL